MGLTFHLSILRTLVHSKINRKLGPLADKNSIIIMTTNSPASERFIRYLECGKLNQRKCDLLGIATHTYTPMLDNIGIYSMVCKVEGFIFQ